MTSDTELELRWQRRPVLRHPIVVIALDGLFDAAEAATSAVRRIATRYDAAPMADIDPERFFDFTQRRPVVHFDEQGDRTLTWPENTITAAEVPGDDRDLVLLAGVEPHLRWRTFCDLLLEVVETVQADMVVTVGAMVGLAPHTRPLGVVASSTDEDLARRLGLSSPSYQGPTGVVGALHDRFDRADVPVISLRVSVPHYVPSPPNPEASRTLLARLQLVTGIDGGHEELTDMANDWRLRVDAAVEDDDDMRQYVAHLESQVDQEVDDLLPSGDDLAAQLEAFLRDNRPEGED